MTQGTLTGRTIVVTRPREQAAGLAAGIEAAGGHALLFPLLEITPVADLSAVHAVAHCLDDYALAVFVSPNAVAYAVPALLAKRNWPAALQAAAVGPGTAQALAAAGVTRCLLPAERFDSEGLLALPELAAEKVCGQRVVIFRGDGGRELLTDVLRERGASVERVTCYHRSGPRDGFAPLEAAWARGALDGIVVSSSEALDYLLSGVSPAARARLQDTPLFVPHQRIAEIARQRGLTRIEQTGPADAGLLHGLVTYTRWTQ